jgi:hypothetical protein
MTQATFGWLFCVSLRLLKPLRCAGVASHTALAHASVDNVPLSLGDCGAAVAPSRGGCG